MAYTIYPYTYGAYRIGRGDILMHSAPLRILLVTSSYVYSNGHEDYADITNEVSTGNGYTLGGQTITGQTWTADTSARRVRLTGNVVEWTVPNGQTLTAAGAILRKYDATAGNSWLMYYLDFGGNRSASNEVFRLTPDAVDGYGYLAG